MAATLYVPLANAKTPDNHVSFDTFVLSQSDPGGPPYNSETFFTVGSRVDLRFLATPRLAVRNNIALVLIMNEDPEVPEGVQVDAVSSASGRILYSDSTVGVDWKPAGGKWTFSPGIYYHHQNGYVAGGPDLVVQRELAGGDTNLFLSYSLRIAGRQLSYWDGDGESGLHHMIPSHTVLLGWTQNLSRSWLTNVSAVYARQDGVLQDTFNFVILFDGQANPIYLVDERLPMERNRMQVNARGRYAPRVGVGLGLDASYYLDDWGIRNYAAEPNLAATLTSRLRARVWYRFAIQTESRYFRAAPTALMRYQTQDPDLGSFHLQSPGAELAILLGDSPKHAWWLRAAAIGFYRSDAVSAMGGNIGLTREW